jgi:4-hydroxy-4-methyl-2-oxoglutarate aldolase
MPEFICDFQRPPTDVVDAFGELSSAVLSDVMGRRGAMDSGIAPVALSMRMAGTAFTVKAYPADNLMCHVALKLARPGDILVVDAGRYTDAALWGELMSLNAQARELGGLIIDGSIRDRRALEEIGFPVFARDCVPNGTFKSNLGELNVPVACGGLSVAPGDIVLGDADGVSVVPQEETDDVLERAQKQVEKEAALRRQIKAGHTLFDLLGLASRFQQ